jgi:hypothetical protein
MNKTVNGANLKFAVIMGAVTTFFVTLIIVPINIYFPTNFILAWLRSWGIATFIVALSILFVGPRIKQFINRK